MSATTEMAQLAASPLPLEHPEEVLSAEQKRGLTQPGWWLSALGAGLYAVNWVFMRILFRLWVRGWRYLPRTGPCVLVANHASYLDPFALAASLPYGWLRRARWAAAERVIRWTPLNRLICRIAQAVPVEQDHAPGANVAMGAAVLKRGYHLIWFPEGRRSLTGDLQPFRSGIGLLLEHLHVPVVPVVIRGTFAALPTGRRVPRLWPITVLIGPPLDPSELERRGAGAHPHERILDTLHHRLEALFQRV
jgi:long-chain acyl-CoA synthetase